MKKFYVSPSVEVIEAEVEEGFAASSVTTVKGLTNDFTTNNFGGVSGRTMQGFF